MSIQDKASKYSLWEAADKYGTIAAIALLLRLGTIVSVAVLVWKSIVLWETSARIATLTISELSTLYYPLAITVTVAILGQLAAMRAKHWLTIVRIIQYRLGSHSY